MKVYVETNPEAVYSGRVKDEVKTTEIRMWFETDEEIEVLSLADYTKQVRKEVCDEIRNRLIKYTLTNDDFMFDTYYKVVDVEKVLDQIKGE